ncbi:hypothetical protein CAPTEDRAFT_111937 [Capitella teleta]|uniref:non-specific serine/threonine protein kinase n=1 Tax=Capitella teleta TaxID=283909 RepID=X1YV76_CAPTE|nr:hypothetical protein CAPTEDRAFT_111937 [Capitella teleta]|eukprot:ELU04715.1 hypothetical protein CAPTEDRAFT_111937 [Capitella teleta]
MEKYEKIRVVGRGAYGTVYLCRRLADNKHVIIKQIPVEQMTKEERQAALNEVKVLSMLDHPNIIEYYENFLEDKALMIVMEYAQGGTLFEYLQQRNELLLEEEEILRFFAQMLLSLQHVHSKQILHRDLKTQNILLNKKKEAVKISDFGISKFLSSKSKAYTVVGTPCYISPELCEGKPYPVLKSDIWALGCVLYELVSLKRAFEAQNLPALILKIMRGTISPISEDFSEELRKLILSMLHLDPNKRPDISQIMAQPLVLQALMSLYTDQGKVTCRRIPKSLSNYSGQNRGRVSRGSSITSKGFFASYRHSSTSKTSPLQSRVYCWGGGISAPHLLPLPSSDTHITEVSTGRTQKAAVTKNGRLLLWETPSVGAEPSMPGATGAGGPAFIPRYLEGQSAVTIKHVSCGDLFTACLTDRGILMTFGSGANGCLGHGNYNDVSQAKIVEDLLGFEVSQVSCGASHVMAVTNEHDVFSWGRGDNGRLGLGHQESCCSPCRVPLMPETQPISALCGVDCSMLLVEPMSTLFCCGSNRYNKLALDRESEHVEEVHSFCPVQSLPLASQAIAMVAMGTSHAAAIMSNGECYTFGSNQFGQLGIPANGDNNMPTRVLSLSKIAVSMVSCGDTFTVAIMKDGKIYSWGKAARGRLGRLDCEDSQPAPVVFKDVGRNVMSVVSISCSHGTTLLGMRCT